MPRRKKSSKRSGRKDLTVSEANELEELKAELTDSLDTSSSSNSSVAAASGDGIDFPIASHSSCGFRSRVLSSSAPSSPTRDRSSWVSCGSRPSVKSLVTEFECLSLESVFQQVRNLLRWSSRGQVPSHGWCAISII